MADRRAAGCRTAGLRAAGLLALLAGPAAASPCGEGIAALEARLRETATTAGAASSGGQAVAAARGGQAGEAREAGQAAGAPAVPFQAEAREARATERAAEAAGGGEGVMQATVALNRARTMNGRGDAAGCAAALEEARGQLGGR